MAKGDWWLKLDINEWLNDPKLRRLRRENRDSWLTACLMMTLEGEFQIRGTRDEIANLLHLTIDEFNLFIDDLKRTNVADVTLRNDCVTLISRRYKKEAKSKELTRLRVRKLRGNDDVTPVKRDRVISKKLLVRKEEDLGGVAADTEGESVPVDVRKNHPAIVAIHEAVGIYPPKESWDDLIDRMGVDVDIGRLKATYAKWRARGYNKTNYDGFVDWYTNGIPKQGKQNGTGTRTSEREKSAQRGANAVSIIDELRRQADAEEQALSGQYDGTGPPHTLALKPAEPD